MRGDAVRRITDALEARDARRQGTNWTCPAHADRTPSLTVRQGDEGALVKCRAGCATEQVVAELGLTMADLFDEPRTNGDREIVEAYPYVDERGELLYEVVRLHPKDFRQRRPDGRGGWEWKLGNTPRVLYRLPRVLEQVRAGGTVYVVEGEKDVQAVERAGGVATCNPGGAGKWRDEYREVLRGAHVVIVADRDEAGYEHAAKVARSLEGIAASVRVVEATVGKDAADHLCAGKTLDEFEEVADALASPPPAGERYHGRVLDLRAELAEPDTPIPWRCESLVADGFLTVLAGRGGEGKSWLALALACGVARGEVAAGIPCTRGRALLFDAENGPRLMVRRFRAAGVNADTGVQPVDAGGLRVIKDLDWFRQVIEDQGADFVVFDSLRVLSSGSKESDGDEMEPIVTALKELARTTGAAVLLIHHRGKAESSEYRGSSVILDQTDLLFTLGRVTGDPEGRHRRKITTIKCRIEEEPPPRWVRIETPAFGRVRVEKADPFEGDNAPRPRDDHRTDVLAALADSPHAERKIADAVGLSKTTTRRILQDLETDGLAKQTGTGWVVHPVHPLPNGPVDHPPNGSNGNGWRPHLPTRTLQTGGRDDGAAPDRRPARRAVAGPQDPGVRAHARRPDPRREARPVLPLPARRDRAVGE